MARLHRLICCLLVLSAAAFAQEETGASWGGSIPEQILRPQRGGEAPRYPRDIVIGELGRGEASEEAYRFARDILSAFLYDNSDAASLSGIGPLLLEETRAALKEISPVKFRIGGGREEDDGNVSFLFRFLGREQGIAGELYIRSQDEKWLFDDILIEDPHDTTARLEIYPYDFTPYERFF
ncbi:MAG: hypothetical protein LBI91_00420 [Spirochaetaceae bacterium]|jgi:hypothetical protein|nr:hypothetical protein [Spirochaetaceae bacterium]